MTEVIKNIICDIPLTAFVRDILPEQGCVELQRDKPGKVHDWHRHPNEEVLIILEGTMTFSLETGDHKCGPGDALRLSANDLHRSEAGPDGAIYLISFRDIAVKAK